MTHICCISHEFYKTATQNPNKTAIINTVNADGNQTHDTCQDKILTYSQLISAIDSLSFKLNNIINGGDDPFLIKPTLYNNNKTKVSKNRIIGVYMVPCVEYIVTVLSILRCGLVFLPIDPFWPKDRILTVILSSNVDLIVGCFCFDCNDSAHLINKSDTSVNLTGKVTRDDILDPKLNELIDKLEMPVSLAGKVTGGEGDTHDLDLIPKDLVNKSDMSVNLAGKVTGGDIHDPKLNELIDKTQMSVSLAGKVTEGDTHDLALIPKDLVNKSDMSVSLAGKVTRVDRYGLPSKKLIDKSQTPVRLDGKVTEGNTHDMDLIPKDLVNNSRMSLSLAGKFMGGENDDVGLRHGILINNSQMSVSLGGKVTGGDNQDLNLTPISMTNESQLSFSLADEVREGVAPFTRKMLINKSHWLVDCCKVDLLCVDVDDILEGKCGKFDFVWPCENNDLREFSYLMYTSGSTGKPKGVCGSEKAVLNRFLWMQELYPLSHEDDVLLFKTSISFVDHIQEFLAPMLVGCTLVIPPFDELKRNMFGLVDYVHEYAITRLTVVPSLIRTILPALERRYSKGIESSLKMLALSGEVFPISLLRTVSRILPSTCVLNIYGSTEVAGDCTYFDCKWLPLILESEMLSSVPIGEPISNCNIRIVSDDGKEDEGELCVAGVCVSSGYYSEGELKSLDCIRLKKESDSCDGLSGELYYRTGDFARRLQNGDFVFLGRKDRTIKINGQRIALEEVEETLRGHPNIVDVAVVFCNQQEEHAFLGAVLVLKDTSQSSDVLLSLKNWMVDRVPSAMIPREIVCVEEIPMSSTGKVDYVLLSSSFSRNHSPNEGHLKCNNTLEHIKETFSKALSVTEFGNDDDFFVFGGDSILAAHVAHKLGIDMRMLYMFPSPSRLHKALSEKEGVLNDAYQVKWETLPKTHPSEDKTSDFGRSRKHSKAFLTLSDEHGSSKHLKVDTVCYSKLKTLTSVNFPPWESFSVPAEYSLGRCNKRMHKLNVDLFPQSLEFQLQSDVKGALRELWRVPMDSCVDASPLVVFKNDEILIFIGSHSHKFVCINARNGHVIWEVKLEGRIESSAVVDGDFSQVIVGCYQGNIYFIDILKGTINWTFQTGDEVKSQPAVDKSRNLVWCGSHDHNLYGLDYRKHCRVYQFPCGGTIFGSPVIDEIREVLYLGTTNGRLIAITLKDSVFSSLWLVELKSPIFGSLSIGSNGNVVCCLVNGDVLSVNLKGSIGWRSKTDGPIFAGPCLSMSLGSQAVICSRNGRVYSFDIETGCIIWEYDVGDPITSSAYVDDLTDLVSDNPSPSQRLVCICSSSGRVLLLLVSCVTTQADKSANLVRKFAEINLEGDVFSSPVMVAGRIFVGCRDDYLHCLVAEMNLGED